MRKKQLFIAQKCDIITIGLQRYLPEKNKGQGKKGQTLIEKLFLEGNYAVF
jgi:hypothetical protein